MGEPGTVPMKEAEGMTCEGSILVNLMIQKLDKCMKHEGNNEEPENFSLVESTIW